MKKIKMVHVYHIKINNRLVYNIWKQMSEYMISETLIDDVNIQQNINGITVSPKKKLLYY